MCPSRYIQVHNISFGVAERDTKPSILHKVAFGVHGQHTKPSL